MEDEGIEVIVGTYEEFLLGYRLKKSEDGDGKEKYTLEQSFTNHSHSGSIRCCTVVGKYLASGSADEAVRLVNMGLRVEHGYMQQQSGTITCLTNYGSKYLFSGCTDGTICIWKSGSWICEKTLKAHQGGVNDVSIHPSGKLALSVGADKSLKTWNLIKGRTGFVTNLHGVGDVVRWSLEGSYYAVGICNRLDVYSVQTAKVVYSTTFGKRVSCICFPKEDVVMVAGDKDTVEVHSITKCKKLTEFKAHKIRVKDMKFVEQHDMLVTGSNCDQFIKLWRFPDDSFSSPPSLLTEFDTTCRITGLTVWSKSISKSQTEVADPDAEVEPANNSDNSEDEEETPNKSEKVEKKKERPTKKVVKLKLKLKDKKRKKVNQGELVDSSSRISKSNKNKEIRKTKSQEEPPRKKRKIKNKS